MRSDYPKPVTYIRALTLICFSFGLFVQDAAQAAGQWHQALTLERSIREISPRIRQTMGLLAPSAEGVSEL